MVTYAWQCRGYVARHCHGLTIHVEYNRCSLLAGLLSHNVTYMLKCWWYVIWVQKYATLNINISEFDVEYLSNIPWYLLKYLQLCANSFTFISTQYIFFILMHPKASLLISANKSFRYNVTNICWRFATSIFSLMKVIRAINIPGIFANVQNPVLISITDDHV